VQALLSTPVTEFAEIARGYCAWCEGQSLGSDPEFHAARWLARLYAAALALPQVACKTEDGDLDLPEPELARAKSNLAPFVGWYYRECFDPDPLLNEAPCMGDLGDDLLDIYKDIKGGLVLFNTGNANDALWDWAFLHKIHWGRHAVGGLFALHCMHVSKMD
jgi:Domain of unknown function (DUF5063)